MSTPQSPLTYEQMMSLFLETREQMKESDRNFNRRMKKIERKFQESAEQLKATQKEVGKLGSRIGEIIENMVKGDVVAKFQAFDYDITEYSLHKKFANKDLNIRGEVDLFLEDGDVAILLEVKTALETKDVRDHIERIEKYRRYADAKGGDKRRFIGAVAGAVVMGDAEKVAHENGMYVIVQSGEAVEIVEPPEGFKAKEW